MQASIRSFALIAIVFSAGCSSDGLVGDRPTPSTSATDSAPVAKRPRPNIPGSEIRLVKQHPAETDPVPEVRPAGR